MGTSTRITLKSATSNVAVEPSDGAKSNWKVTLVHYIIRQDPSFENSGWRPKDRLILRAMNGLNVLKPWSTEVANQCSWWQHTGFLTTSLGSFWTHSTNFQPMILVQNAWGTTKLGRITIVSQHSSRSSLAVMCTSKLFVICHTLRSPEPTSLLDLTLLSFKALL